MKKIKCNVCDHEFSPYGRRYTAVKHNGISGIVEGEKKYDAFDCPLCGCQITVQERMDRKNESEEG